MSLLAPTRVAPTPSSILTLSPSCLWWADAAWLIPTSYPVVSVSGGLTWHGWQAESEGSSRRILELEAALAAQQSPVKEGEEEGATTVLQMQVG